MEKAVLLAKRNYWVAGIGAIVSLIAFLFFPFLTVEASISLPLLGSQITEQSVNAPYLAVYQGLLWVSLLPVLAVLGVALVFLLRRNPFGSQVPVQVQAHWTALGFVIAGVLSAVFLVWSLLLTQQHAQDAMSFLKIIGANFSVTWAFGAYLFLLGLAAIVAAGLMQVIWPVKIPSDGGMGAYPPNSSI